MPRVTEDEFKARSKLTRAKSFWSGFKRDTEKVLDECMSADWSRAKVMRLIKDADERQAVEKLIRSNYKQLLCLYRYLSAVGVVGDTPLGISQIEATTAFEEANLIDATTRISDVDRFFIASKVLPIDMKKQSMAVRNDKALGRHQFLELIMRVAEQRFLQKGEATSMTEAVTRLLAHLAPSAERQEREIEAFFAAFHTEPIDDVFKKYQNGFREVYKRFSGGTTAPGQPPFMALAEFQQLLEGVGAYDSRFQARWSAYAFRMGMMTQADEVFCARFQEMSFLEFQHAVGAVIFLRANYSAQRLPALLEEFIVSKLLPLVPRQQPSQPCGVQKK